MKDKAIQGLAQANTKNKLAKDAEVAKRNKENVGRRNDYKKGLSTSAIPTSSASPFFSTTKSNTSSLLTTRGNNKNSEAKKRLQQKKQDQVIKMAQRMPVLNKYAKAAKAAKIIRNSGGSKGGFFKNIFGGFGSNEKKPTEVEQDAALSADAAGEDYDEYEAASSATFKLDKKTKTLLIGIGSGSFFAVIFTCIFVMAAITTSGGEAYLASKDNPTEEELETQYNKQDADDISAHSENEEAYLEYEPNVVQYVADISKYGYDPKDLSDYFGTKQACTDDGSVEDCRNGDEYKFYLKMYDMYYLYKNKYNVKLDLPLIMATLYYNDVELPVVFSNNLNNYDRKSLNNKNQVTNLDWEYDYKNIPGYQYLDSDNSCYDMQILAKNMVTKNITYQCSDGAKKEIKDIETSNYSNNTLKCDSGSYDKNTVNATYKLDLEKYDEFLLEYIKLKYHTKGSGKKYEDGNYVSGVSFLNGGFGKVHYYNQGDYSNYSYGNFGTIASHGCGPTSLAIVISSFLNEEHDPIEVTNYVCSIGGCSNDGTYHSAIADTAKHYGLKVNKTGDTQQVINALSKGDSLVIAIMCPGHFTTSGHFITLTGSSSEGKVTVADPGNRNNNKDWDFNIVAEETCEAGGAPYWIISK